MTDLPHVIAGQPVPLAEEYIRVLEAFVREFDLPPDRRVLTAGNVNAAVDWWNAPVPRAEVEKLRRELAELREFANQLADTIGDIAEVRP